MNPSDPTTTLQSEDSRQVLESAKTTARAKIEEAKKEREEIRAREESAREEKLRKDEADHQERTVKLLGHYGLEPEEIKAVFLPLALRYLDRDDVRKFLARWKEALRRVGNLFSRRILVWSHSHGQYQYGGCIQCHFIQNVLSAGMNQVAGMRRATRDEYDAFVAGWIAKGNKPKPGDIIEHSTFRDSLNGFHVAANSFTLLPVEHTRIIVPKGVQVRKMKNIGRDSTLYFMDGFHIVGKKCVPIYTDTIMSEEAKLAEEEATANRNRVVAEETAKYEASRSRRKKR